MEWVGNDPRSWTDGFTEMVVAEGRPSALDLGAGPGSDAQPFIQAGIGYTGIDLDVANGVLAHEAGVTVIAASLFDLPFPDATFEAAWSMSTMMHVPTAEVDEAMRSICRALAPGAPLMIRQWGGSLGDIDSDHTVPRLRWLSSLRTADHNRELLVPHGTIVQWEVRDAGPDGWEYHAAVLRLPT
jgi:SAM-dependent methyltransferase